MIKWVWLISRKVSSHVPHTPTKLSFSLPPPLSCIFQGIENSRKALVLAQNQGKVSSPMVQETYPIPILSQK